MPGSAKLRVFAIAAAVLAVGVGLEFGFESIVPDGSLRQLFMTVCCNVIIAVSLNVINGMAGQFSIGHAGFVGIGAYTSAVIASNMQGMLGGEAPTFATSFIVVPVALIASAGFAGLFGLLLGLPSLRLKGDYLAIVTLGFAEIFRLVIATAQVSKESVSQAWSMVGGEGGVVGPFFHFIGVMISSLGGQNGYQGVRHEIGVPLYAGPFWVIAITGLLCLLAWRIKFSGWGRALRALREDEIAAAAVGVDPTRYKVTSFVIAAVGAGVAGGLLALMRDGTPSVSPDSFNFQASFDAITMVILGGSGSVTGAMLGALLVTGSVKAIEALSRVIQDAFDSSFDASPIRMILYASLLVLLMILRPEGLLGERELGQKKKKRAKPTVSSEPGNPGNPVEPAKAAG